MVAKRGKVSDILVTLRLSHNLSLWSPITAKEMVMRVAITKHQLTEMTRNGFIKNVPAKSNQISITAPAEAPEQVKLGVQIIRHDLKLTQQETDVIIHYHVSQAITYGTKYIKIICKDNDVSVLLCYYYDLGN